MGSVDTPVICPGHSLAVSLVLLSGWDPSQRRGCRRVCARSAWHWGRTPMPDASSLPLVCLLCVARDTVLLRVSAGHLQCVHDGDCVQLGPRHPFPGRVFAPGTSPSWGWYFESPRHPHRCIPEGRAAIASALRIYQWTVHEDGDQAEGSTGDPDYPPLLEGDRTARPRRPAGQRREEGLGESGPKWNSRAHHAARCLGLGRQGPEPRGGQCTAQAAARLLAPGMQTNPVLADKASLRAPSCC